MSVPATHIVFDLDGTLVDSAPGILSALKSAFAGCSLEPVRAITEDIVGPPLMESLAELSDRHDSQTLQRLASAFKENYDDHGYQRTIPYVGVERVLGELKSLGYSLSIATNKRILPTQRLIRYLDWESYFCGVYALDSFTPALSVKADMLGRVLVDNDLVPRHSVYIGDRDEDGKAATINQMPFLLATWGYGKSALDAGWVSVKSPDDIPAAIWTLGVGRVLSGYELGT